MNYFAHALPFLDRPYVAAATGVPDMLAVVDRSARLRVRHVEPHVADPDPITADVAQGLLQHLKDDACFHRTAVFAELSTELTMRFRDALEDDSGLRPRFLGHLLVELLLDATLAARQPDQLERYYQVLGAIDAPTLQQAVNRMAPRPTPRLVGMVAGILHERFLSDYLDDARLLGRLNQIMRRAKLDPLPESFVDVLPEARLSVARHRDELLAGIPVRL